MRTVLWYDTVTGLKLTGTGSHVGVPHYRRSFTRPIKRRYEHKITVGS